MNRGFIADPSLVLYLPLRKLDGAAVMSKDPYGHLCTVTGATWTPQGFAFSIDDYISIASSLLNFTSGNFTISAWINISSLAGEHWIVSRGLVDADGYYFYVTNNGMPAFASYDGGQRYTNGATGDIAANTWYQLTAVRSGTSVNLYKNGVDITVVVGTHNAITTSARVARIGIYDDLTSGPFTGKMDNVEIYSRALAPQEIQRIYLATKGMYA